MNYDQQERQKRMVIPDTMYWDSQVSGTSNPSDNNCGFNFTNAFILELVLIIFLGLFIWFLKYRKNHNCDKSCEFQNDCEKSTSTIISDIP